MVASTGCGASKDEPKGNTASTQTAPSTAKPSKPKLPELPTPDDAGLLAGKATFEFACITCHTKGRDEAPVAFDTDAWAPRLAQGRDTLVQHAIEGGFFRSEHSEWGMPARGGKKDLTDEQIAQAVDYILFVLGQSPAAPTTGTTDLGALPNPMH